jgi:hypothetical protein
MPDRFKPADYASVSDLQVPREGGGSSQRRAER